jgi:hypothetical protein
MFLMRADPLRGQVGGSWSLEIESFWGPMIWYQADIGECHLGPKKFKISRDPTPPTCPNNGSARIKNHYVQGRINHRCIGGIMCKSPQVTLTGYKGIS